jgi:hypothetical protein
MRSRLILLLLLAATPARAEILNLSCDDGGMLLLIDTDKATVTDKNPFQKTEVTAPLSVTDAAFTWQERANGVTAEYALDKTTRRVLATVKGETVPLSNPQCGKSARLLPR